jgi:AbrB family transcriptional regulator (stage V sporulation protein T)
MGRRVKISGSGKIALPAALMRELELKPGDTIVIEREGDRFVLKSRTQALREVQAAIKDTIAEPFTVDEFIAERRLEAPRE